MDWIPTRFTVGVTTGLTRAAIRVIGEVARRNDVDPRAMAAQLILEALQSRGLLDSTDVETEHVG